MNAGRADVINNRLIDKITDAMSPYYSVFISVRFNRQAITISR